METLDRALIAIGAATALLLVMTIIATAAERDCKTLEQVNREINAYWAQQRFEAYQRRDQQLQERQLEALQEQNTEGE